jgi:hypothetical protein
MEPQAAQAEAAAPRADRAEKGFCLSPGPRPGPAGGSSEFSASGGTDAVTVPAQPAAGAKDKVPESTIL